MKFGDVLKNPETEGKEKHVPVIEIEKGCQEGIDIVRVTVGKEVAHPNTIEHHIVWIELFGVKQNGQVVDIGRCDFGATLSNPSVRFKVIENDYKAFCALSYCNIHGVWQNCLDT